MKIPLRFGEDGLLYLLAFIRLPRRGLGQIEFIIDTGSNNTFINWLDVLKLNIPFTQLEQLPEDIRYSGVAGVNMEFRKAGQTSMIVMNEEGNASVFISTSMLVGKPLEIKNDFVIPSVIGTDFLVEHNLVLHFDPVNKEYYLEQR